MQRRPDAVCRHLAVGLLLLQGPASVSAQVATEADPRPERIGPGTLSAGEVYRGSFTPDGHTLYFFKKVGENESYGIFSSTRGPDGWSAPARVDLGGEFSDLYPSLSRDGRRMVWSSYRPVPGTAGGKPSAHLWYADRTDAGWGAPVFMARASTIGHYHSWVEFGFDGAVYFRRTTPDWTRTVTLRTRWTGAEYGSPEPYADAEQWRGWRTDVDVAGGSPGPDGTVVFLDVATRNPRTGRGASDIWVSRKRNGGWTLPRPLGSGVNSEGYDVFPFFSPDGRDLYFVRDFATFHRVPLAEALASAEDPPELRYVANAGVLVTVGGRRFLIDAPIRSGIAPYATSPARERDRIEAARPPYDGVDAILITHWHEDHFSPEAAAAHLARNPRAAFVSSPEVVERLRAAAPDLSAARLRAVLPSPGEAEEVRVGDVPVRVLRIRHNPTRRLPEQHVGFLIGDGAPVLHVGDADPAVDNFALLRGLPRVDLALLPFWYVLDPASRRFVAEAIRPRRIVGLHLPPGDAGRVAAALREASVPVVLPPEPGSLVMLDR
jgi:L-ascorbate metabolism protein UlaG (beta-lactamase superfamily)